ncbi:MAG: MG2 domain-containing protein [Nannocystaceae bacterium]
MQRRRLHPLAWSTLTRPSLAVALAAAGLSPLACTKGQEQPATTGDAAPATVELDLWAGVPPLELEAGDIATELRPKEGPKPPTGASKKEALPFAAPPPEGPPPPVAAEGPLKVLRYGPVGDQTLVDAVSVVFNQPMIPLASVSDLRQEHVPITIEPQPPGKIRWLGTEALAFEAEGRFPFSTTYTVTVAAGERSTIGGALAKEHRFAFTTPTLAIESSVPGDLSEGNLLDAPLVLRFNQPIRRDALMRAGVALSGGGQKIALAAVPEAEWKDVKEAAWAIDRGADDRLLILRPQEKLQPNTRYTVTIPGGAFGEGPNPSKSQALHFTTYPPLRLSVQTCYAWSCNPETGFTVESSTPLQPANLEGKVRITPEVENLKIAAGGGGIAFAGDFIGETTYTVAIDAGIADIHGQVLDKPFKGTVRIRALEPGLGLAVAHLEPAVIERSAPATLPLRITGLDAVEVRSRSFPIDKLGDFMNRRWFGSERTWPEDVPSPTKSTTLSVGSSKRRVLRERLDLAPHLRKGEVLFLAMRSNSFQRWGYSDRYTMTQTVQVTDLGITAAVDRDSGVVMITSIERGEPLAGVDVSLVRGYSDAIWTGKTDDRGLVEISGVSGLDTEHLVVARSGDDAAFLPLNQSVTGTWWNTYGIRDPEPRAFFYNDRQPYKPGETAHVAGILRQEAKGPEGSVALWRTDFSAKWTLTSPRGEETAKGETKVSPLGTFSVDIPLDEGADLGDYNFNLAVGGGWFGSEERFFHSFLVDAYRAPEFEVDVEREEAAPLRFGDTLKAKIQGRYLHGAPLVGGAVTYTLRRQESGFSPPGPENAGFTFGPSSGWPGGRYFGGFGESFGLWSPEVLVAQGAGALDALGTWPVEHVLKAIEKDLNAPDAKPPEPSDDPPRPASYTLEAQVVDQNRQSIAGRSTYVVHPALAYAGVRADRAVYRAGEQARIEAVVVDLEGQRQVGRPIEIELVREETTRKAVEKDGVWTYEYKTEKVSAGSCKETTAAAPVPCDLKVGEAGSYIIRALTRDADGKASLTTRTIYVHGEDAVVWDQDQKRVDLVADRRDYAPGDTATILIRSPFDRARGLAVIERDGIVRHEPVEVVGGTATLSVKIPEAAIPNLHVGVVLVRGRVDVPGAPPGQDLGRPSQAAGVLELKVSSEAKKIAVELTPDRRELAPKETLKVKIQTRDHTGAGAPAAMALMVVDEGVLSLLGFQTPDPLAFFHHPREPGAQIADLRAYLLQREEAPKPVTPEAPPPPPPATPPMGGTMDLEQKMDDSSGLGLSGYGRGGGGVGEASLDFKASAAPAAEPARSRHAGEEGKMGKPSAKAKDGLYAMRGPAQAQSLDANKAMAQEVSLRALFASTAYYNPEVRTDEKGEATVEIPMPENLTSFRIMAVAVDPEVADRFGSADTSVKVRKPIMLRPSLPRFANFGDHFEASVMVDNQTSSPAAIMVGTRGLGVTISGDAQRTLEIGAGESKEVRFPMSVDEVGKLRLQFAALANEGRDATEVTIPVNLPVTRQAFADYGVTDESIARLIKAPMDALPGFGGLELSLSSTALTGLEDAARYLISYDYECSEQTASRILPIFVLGAIFDGFAIEGAGDKGRRDGLAKDGIARLLGRQNWDGGFRFWDTSARSWPYLTTWVTFALLEGKAAGYDVNAQALENALDYLTRYVQNGETTPWGRYYDYTSHAFALWLLSRENRGSELFDRVHRHKAEIPLYGHALLLSAAHKYKRTREVGALKAELVSKVIEDAKNAHFVEGTSEDLRDGLSLLMHSSVQTDAIALMALLEVAPEDPLLPKVMAGIMAERDPRVGGRWPTTHANAWALLAANRYYTVVEKVTPDYVARIWLDDGYAGEQEFRGRSMTVTEHKIPMRRLQSAPEQTLTLAKEGPGKLYYRLGLRYAPASMKIAAEAQGFVVSRTYEAVAQGADKVDPDAVRQEADGTWVVKAGSMVKVNLTLVARDRANFVVVDDPLPAGLEGQNSRFETTLRDVASSFGPGGGFYGRGGYGGYGGLTRWYSDWWFPWWTWDHTELRDDRLLLFADRLPAGVYTYSYLARATTIGEFQLPPIHAEGMYTPERFGHSASGVLRVVE